MHYLDALETDAAAAIPRLSWLCSAENPDAWSRAGYRALAIRLALGLPVEPAPATVPSPEPTPSPAAIPPVSDNGLRLGTPLRELLEWLPAIQACPHRKGGPQCRCAAMKRCVKFDRDVSDRDCCQCVRTGQNS